LVNGILVEYVGLSALVSTLATGQVLAGFASIWYERHAVFLSVPKGWKHLTRVNFGPGISYILLISVGLALLLSVVLSHTAIGRRLTAASTSKRAGGYQGIRVRRYRAATYVVASLMYTLAGMLLVGEIGTPALSLGEVYQLSTIVAVVLGGAALSGSRLHPAATFAGALFLSLINQDVAASGIASGAQSVIQGAVLVAAMVASTLGAYRNVRRRSLRGSFSNAPP
jgi:ribose transport system permease protein